MPPIGLTRQSSPNLELVKTALDKIKDDTLMAKASAGKATAENQLVFTQDVATNAAVISTVQGGGGYFQKKTIDAAKSKAVAINSPTPKTTLIAEFDKTLMISRTFMADQQHSSVNIAVRDNTDSWIASRDQNAFSVYANGFTTQTTIDGVALFSASHQNAAGITVDNLASGALSDSTLNDGIVKLRNQLNQSGVKVGRDPAFLLVSNAGHKNAMTVTDSVLRSGTGNNDLNYYSELFPGLQTFWNQFLDDVSTTAWFVGAPQHGIHRFVREAFNTTLVDWQYSENHMYKYIMLAREEVDSITYSGLVGSLGV